jgi:cobalt-zinc-cadmium efflux system protein
MAHPTTVKEDARVGVESDPPSPDLATEKKQSARLLLVLILIGSFFVVELVGAKLARSDVLEADAFHLLMDVFALGISLLAMRVASRRPSDRFTFGLRRAEPLAALANGILVLGVAIELVRDAVEHVGHSSMPRSELMLAIATAALVMNGLNAWLLHGAMGHAGHGHHGHAHGHGHGHAHAHDADSHAHDSSAHAHAHADASGAQQARGHALNLRGAWLHLLGDALGSFAAFVAGVAIKFGAPPVVDPLASFVVVAILVIGAIRLVRDAGLVLLESAPAHLPVARIEKAILAVDGITKVHNIHVWSLGTGHDAIMARVATASSDLKLAKRTSEHLRKKFGVEYVTIEVEPD